MSRAWPYAVLATTVIAAVLRFGGLGDHSLWEDEVATLRQVRPDLWGMIAGTAMDTYPPGYNIFTWISVKLFGEAEWALRLPAAIFGVLCVPATYWLGKLTATRPAALIGAALLAVSPFAIAYSHEARAYTLLMLTGTLFTGCIYAVGSGREHRLEAAIVSGAALLYSHPYGTLLFASVVLAMFGWTLTGRTASPVRRKLLVAAASSFAIFLPWALILALVAARLNAEGFWIERPTALYIVSALVSIIGGKVLADLVALITLAALIMAVVRRGEGVPVGPTAFTVLGAAAFGPLLLGVAISLISAPVFVSRYLSGGVPSLLVLVGAATVYLARGRVWFWALSAILAVVALQAWWVGPNYAGNQDWRGAAARIVAEASPVDCVMVRPGVERLAVSYYLRDALDCVIAPVSPNGNVQVPSDANKVFLVGIASRLGDIPARAREVLTDAEWSEERQDVDGLLLDAFVRR